MDEQDSGSTLRLAVGDTIDVQLLELRVAGYRWALTSDGAPALTYVGDVYESAASRAGGPGTHAWRFRAAQAGRASIELISRRSWEPPETVARTFSLDVTVSGEPA